METKITKRVQIKTNRKYKVSYLCSSKKRKNSPVLYHFMNVSSQATKTQLQLPTIQNSKMHVMLFELVLMNDQTTIDHQTLFLDDADVSSVE